MEAYEKALSCELAVIPTASPVSNINIQQNVIEQNDTGMRRAQMSQLVDKGLTKTEHEIKVKQEMGEAEDIVLKLKDMISTAVKPCPEVALAWTGVTFALQVSTMAPYLKVDANTFADDSQSRQGNGNKQQRYTLCY